jgi:hypothetical protein
VFLDLHHSFPTTFLPLFPQKYSVLQRDAKEGRAEEGGKQTGNVLPLKHLGKQLGEPDKLANDSLRFISEC